MLSVPRCYRALEMLDRAMRAASSGKRLQTSCELVRLFSSAPLSPRPLALPLGYTVRPLRACPYSTHVSRARVWALGMPAQSDSILIAFPLVCRPEPHILLFRRPLGTDPTTGKVDARLAKAAVDKYRKEYDL